MPKQLDLFHVAEIGTRVARIEPTTREKTTSRYIDTEWLENNAKEYSLGYYEEDEWATPISLLENAPSIEIVFCEKCRDCVEKGVGADCPSGYGYLYCRRKKSVVDETDYCSWGVGK